MAVSYKPTSIVAPNSYDNACRWDGSAAPHYEVWFLTLNHRASQRGFWFRYTIDCPSTTGIEASPRAELWAASFNRRLPRQNLGLKQEYPIDQFVFDGNGDSRIKLGNGLFSSCGAYGSVSSASHQIEWDLIYAPCGTTYHHTSRWLEHLARPSSSLCSPNLDTRFSGWIRVDGREIVLDEEPGCQSHLWGRKHLDDWVWVHSNAFEKYPGTVFEGLAARPRRAGRQLPPIQSLYLRHRGAEHRFVRLRLGEQWQHRLGMGYWSFSAMNAGVYIEGTAQCRLRDMLQARYDDPDAEQLYCVNSEVANLKIRIFRRVHGIRWKHIETIKAYATAHFEHGSRFSDQGVQMTFDT